MKSIIVTEGNVITTDPCDCISAESMFFVAGFYTTIIVVMLVLIRYFFH